MQNMTLLKAATILDYTLAAGGLHILVGVTGSGKSAICEILKKESESHAVFYDVQTAHDDETYFNIINDISTLKRHIIIDGYCAPSDVGRKVAKSILNHVRGKYDRFGVLLLVQSIEDLKDFSFGIKTISVINNGYPRVSGEVFFKTFEVDENESTPLDTIDEFHKITNLGRYGLSSLES